MTTLHTNIALRAGAFEIAEPDEGRSQPVRVLPLNYSDGREALFPLIRIGGVVGFLACALTVLALPMWLQGRHSDEAYDRMVHAYMPPLQLVAAGAGLSLIIAGRIMSRRKARFGLLLALALNLVAIGMSQVEMQRQVESRMIRWIYMSGSSL